MKVNEIMANLEAKHPGENEYLQAVREVLETIEKRCSAPLLQQRQLRRLSTQMPLP